MYNEYKIARDLAWKTLIECNIGELPIKLSIIAKYYNIQVLSYKNSNINIANNDDGYSLKLNDKFIIYYNEQKPPQRIRFTLAHELGHCLLGHIKDNEITYRYNSESDSIKDLKEIQANVFARDILMPATVLHSLNVKSADDISNICDVSIQSAEIRFNRLLELNKRGMYNKHPFEKQVYNNFNTYIKRVQALEQLTLKSQKRRYL